jgi:hypothetical protein
MAEAHQSGDSGLDVRARHDLPRQRRVGRRRRVVLRHEAGDVAGVEVALEDERQLLR